MCDMVLSVVRTQTGDGVGTVVPQSKRHFITGLIWYSFVRSLQNIKQDRHMYMYMLVLINNDLSFKSSPYTLLGRTVLLC